MDSKFNSSDIVLELLKQIFIALAVMGTFSFFGYIFYKSGFHIAFILGWIVFTIVVFTFPMTRILVLIKHLRVSKKEKAGLDSTSEQESIIGLQSFLDNLSNHISILFFGVFFFGGLLVTDIIILRNWDDGAWESFLVTLIFWGIGIWRIRKMIKK